ncbi:MAG: sugar ABC transporter permease [Deltaproteobacteria bacterium]|nr:MAG: sugar ABC transporter permease [Deltaproteobacteria bacterium]
MPDAAPSPASAETREVRLAWVLVLPTLIAIVTIALFPLVWTFWESLHLHDLRLPARGRPFVGLANYAEILADPRFLGALAHTLFFTAASVSLELVAGLALALAMHGAYRGRGAVRTAVLLPWAIPTVAAALVWRFLFEGPQGVANAVLLGIGAPEPISWFSDAWLAWVPIVLADVWKTTPFVALLLLAGLQSIDAELYEAARVDGAGRIRELWFVTLPFLRPAILVALIFRTLDAFRVFDLIYVLTGGGPGTATEPLALYTWSALLQNLRFGFGSALSVLIFLVTFALALVYIRLVGADLTRSVR